jgi:hypothetical protein
MEITRRSPARTTAALLAPGVATFLAWWAFLGMDANDNYSVPQCAGLVVALVAIGVVVGWLAHRSELAAVICSAALGISVACWMGWSDDDTGLFVIGWLMVTLASFPGAMAVVLSTWALRNSRAAH